MTSSNKSRLLTIMTGGKLELAKLAEKEQASAQSIVGEAALTRMLAKTSEGVLAAEKLVPSRTGENLFSKIKEEVCSQMLAAVPKNKHKEAQQLIDRSFSNVQELERAQSAKLFVERLLAKTKESADA